MANRFPDWFKKMKPEAQRKYVRKHPNSKVGQLAKGTKDFDSSKKNKMHRDKVDRHDTLSKSMQKLESSIDHLDDKIKFNTERLNQMRAILSTSGKKSKKYLNALTATKMIVKGLGRMDKERKAKQQQFDTAADEFDQLGYDLAKKNEDINVRKDGYRDYVSDEGGDFREPHERRKMESIYKRIIKESL